MQTLRPANDRGTANFGWLDSRHTFSFGHYHDPGFMGFGPLRGIIEDRAMPARVVDTHVHSDMEIISYVLDGALEHKDSMGTGSIIRPGDVQRMSAGTGVRHSEFNASADDPVHFLQIWILPERNGLTPSYEQQTFARHDKLNQLRLVGSRDGRDGSVTIHQDVDLYASILEPGYSVAHTINADRKGWLQVASGTTVVNGEPLAAGDGLAVAGLDTLLIEGGADTEVLLFDMVA